MWRDMAAVYAGPSHSDWSKACPAIKFAVCIERNHLWREKPGPADLRNPSWPCGRPVEAMAIVRELICESFVGLEPDLDLEAALSRWKHHMLMLPVDIVMTDVHTR